MSWTLTDSDTAIDKAGANANSTVTSDSTFLATLSDHAEGWVCSETRRDWVSYFSDLGTQIKGVLNDVTSSKIALMIIAYDTTGYFAREADTLMNLHDGIVTNGIKFLKDFKSKDLKKN